MLFESLQVTKAAVFVDEGILVIETAIFRRIADRFSDQARLGDYFHVDLYPLTGMVHLFIRFWDVLRVLQFHCHLSTVP